MSTRCPHGFAQDECLICRTLGTGGNAVEVADAPRRRGSRKAAPDTGGVASVPSRPDAARPPSRPGARRRGLAGPLVLVLMALLAIGAAAWILAGIVFTVLHLLELIAVGLGAGWVGYRLGHFRGARHSRPG